jgi:hypothetical protein
VPSHDDCLAQNMSRELKSVSLKPPGNEDLHNFCKKFPINETTEKMEIATVYEFDENDGFYTISCDLYSISVIYFVTLFT